MLSRVHQTQHHPGASEDIDWRARLPPNWRDAVDAPLYFRHYREYEIDAQRTVGYDEDDRPCFVAHEVFLTRLSSDDDEEFYESIAYADSMSAWRLHDGRWLVLRITQPGGCAIDGGFYAISPEIPR